MWVNSSTWTFTQWLLKFFLLHIAVSKNSLSLQSQNVDSFTLCTYTALLIWPLNYYRENAQDLKIDFCSFICVIKLFLFMETNFLSKRNVSALLDYHWFRLQCGWARAQTMRRKSVSFINFLLFLCACIVNIQFNSWSLCRNILKLLILLHLVD